MDRRKKILVNEYEVATEASLQRVTAKHNAKVFSKVRVADALDIDYSGLSNDEYSYGLRAHFDFVVTDAEGVSQFAVEFDEPHHYSDLETIRRDKTKNKICDNLGMPLLRIDKLYLQRVAQFATVLDWLIEIWYLEEEWNKRSNSLPEDDFAPFLISEPGYIENGKFVPVDSRNIPASKLEELMRQGRLKFRSYDPFLVYINKIRELANEGICMDPYPNFVENIKSENGSATALAYVRVPENRFVVGEVRCRVSNFTTGGINIAQNLAIVDCVQRLLHYKQGKFAGMSAVELEALKIAIQKDFPTLKIP